MNSTMTKKAQKFDVKRLVFTALMAALAVVLEQFLSFKVPVMPSFISFDFADVPAVLAALTMGPVSGVAVCLVKNLAGLFTSMTGGVGELSNFLLSASLVLPAGFIAKHTSKLSRAIIGCAVGAAAMSLISFVTNYFIVYPIYTAIMPMDTIIGLYKAINPNVNSLAECLVMFNMPFTFVKGAIAAAISVPLYKRLRPIFNSVCSEE